MISNVETSLHWQSLVEIESRKRHVLAFRFKNTWVNFQDD